ncbi:FecR family protein [Chitinophaga sp. GbtcB8]|uniref:FecR family protein n=1 Tax=Chitinophaga sp. GbtcB8 TaxID=2824753 RepID=UPI001C2F4F18|nr:FecR domain-containing protein [Chitinophaga sp. GbtcB8]
MTEKAYHLYTTRDFILDEDFQQWVLHPDVKNTYYWESWLREHPEKRATIEAAVTLVRSIQFKEYTLTEQEKGQLWDNIWEHQTGEEELPVIRKRWWASWKYAAAIILIAATSLWLMQQRSFKPVTYSVYTHLGEVKRAWLPDSSLIILNAGSRLLYTGKADQREVWLDGEAYFHVRHNNQRFIVHTYDKLSVEVLGTQFNVNSFGNKIMVVLQQGQVKLNVPAAHAPETQLYLQPGEMLNYNKLDGSYAKSNAPVSRLLAWTSSRVEMENYTLSDAAIFMQQVFGKRLIMADSQLLRYQVSGSMPVIYNADTMMTQFAKVFNVKFNQKEEYIYIRKGSNRGH